VKLSGAKLDRRGLTADSIFTRCSASVSGFRRIFFAFVAKRLPAKNKERPNGNVLSVARPSGRRAYCLLATGLRAEHGNGDAQMVALFISDPEAPNELPLHPLMQWYGLTRAEAAIAAVLVSVRTIEEAGDALGMSKNTARSHLQHILKKTEARRQSELVALLLGSPAAVVR
jgi:DNA-binding CsgD family transcriptional regulator